jgi:hypothetical protein
MTKLKDKKWGEVQTRRIVMTYTAILFASLAILYGFCQGLGIPFSYCDPIKISQAIILGTWILAPPIWFWYEYFYLFKRTQHQIKLGVFKYGQEQSSKIWFTLVTILLALFFGKNLINRDIPKQIRSCPCSQNAQSIRSAR